jgi:hypothetical protein
MFAPMTGEQQTSRSGSLALLLEAWIQARQGYGYSRTATRPERAQRVGEGCPGVEWHPDLAQARLNWLKPGSIGGPSVEKIGTGQRVEASAWCPRGEPDERDESRRAHPCR